MKRVAKLACMVLLLALLGCNGKTVATDTVPNTGFPSVELADDMRHLDWKEASGIGTCTDPDFPLQGPQAGVKVRSDIYVYAESDIPTDLCLLFRERLLTSWGRWDLLKGGQITVNENVYYEQFGLIRFDQETPDKKSFKDYLAEQGYKTPEKGFMIYKLSRNMSTKRRFELIYLYSLDKVPTEAMTDNAKAMGFLRDRFAERVKLS